ncbi:MAG: hypothetical protein AAFP20_17650 [Cyanobacteria bacterium J06614_10]
MLKIVAINLAVNLVMSHGDATLSAIGRSATVMTVACSLVRRRSQQRLPKF